MTGIPHHRMRVDLAVRDGAVESGGGPLTINRIWLPMIVWEGVPVLTRSSRRLTIMERFVIECLTRMKTCGAEDLREIAAIPVELGSWLLDSCVQKDLARRDGDRFRAEEQACGRALEQNRVAEDVEESHDFLCFPETGEFLLLRNAGQFLRDLRMLLPIGKFPLSERWKRAQRQEVLTEAIKAERVYGEGIGAFLEVRDEACIEQEECPAYHATASLPGPSEGGWRIAIIGKRKQKRRASSEESSKDSPSSVDTVSLPINLPVMSHLESVWQATFTSAGEAIRDKLKEIGFNNVEYSDNPWRAHIDRDVTEKMESERLLTSTVELEVQIDREVDFTVPLELLPADAEARKAFARDAIVQQVLAAPAEVELAALVGNGTTRMPEVRSRLWQLKLFAKVYQLREVEDFRE